MCSVRAASDHERQMLGRTSLPLVGALSLALVAFPGSGYNDSGSPRCAPARLKER
jgi:hypothetical protein